MCRACVPSVVQLSRGITFVLARMDDGTIWAWGSNANGIFGDGTTSNRSGAAQGPTMGGFEEVEAGYESACGRRTDGSLYCWGRNNSGQLGDGTTTHRTVPTLVLGFSSGVTSVGVGETHACAVRFGALYCWGRNDYGQLGDGTTTHRQQPVAVSGLSSGVAQVVADSRHTCAVTVSGAAYCWGYNGGGRLAVGVGSNPVTTPRGVTGLSSGVARMGVGFEHSCAVRTNGELLCWGHNNFGQLGDGTVVSQFVPVQVQGISGVAEVSAGYEHTCARRTDGTVWCWGRNSPNMLGDGTTLNPRTTPVPVVDLTDAISISTGTETTCAARRDGTVRCWGSSNSGGSLVPVALSGFGGGGC